MKKYLSYLHQNEKCSMFIGILLGLFLLYFLNIFDKPTPIKVYAQNGEGVESLVTETVELTEQIEETDNTEILTSTTVTSNLVFDDTMEKSLETRTNVIVGGIGVEKKSFDNDIVENAVDNETIGDSNIENESTEFVEETIENEIIESNSNDETDSILDEAIDSESTTEIVEDIENEVENELIDNIVETENLDNYEVKNVPNDNPKCKSYNITYMSYTSVTSETSNQYKLLNSDSCYTDTKTGIRMVDGRYCIALGSYYTHNVGQKVDLVFKDGTVVNCIIGDCKADIHTDSTNSFHTQDGSVAEFIVDYNYFDSTKQWSDLCSGTIDKIIVIN